MTSRESIAQRFKISVSCRHLPRSFSSGNSTDDHAHAREVAPMGFLHLVDPFLSCRVSAPHERTQCALSFFTDKSPWSPHQVDPMIVLVTPPGKHVTFDTQEDEENAKTLCILGNYGIALDQHREQSTERLANTINPRFQRTFDWEVTSVTRLSDLHEEYSKHRMIFIVYDDPDPFGRQRPRSVNNIIGICECSLSEILSAPASGGLNRPLQKLGMASEYGNPMANGSILINGLQTEESGPGENSILSPTKGRREEEDLYVPRVVRWVAAAEQVLLYAWCERQDITTCK